MEEYPLQIKVIYVRNVSLLYNNFNGIFNIISFMFLTPLRQIYYNSKFKCLKDVKSIFTKNCQKLTVFIIFQFLRKIEKLSYSIEK